jgi:hypothetical protein
MRAEEEEIQLEIRSVVEGDADHAHGAETRAPG